MNEVNLFYLTLGMAIVTYIGRISGYFLIRYTKPSARQQAFFRLVPGTIFIAMIAPNLYQQNVFYLIAAAVTFMVAARFSNLFLALLVGLVSYGALAYLGS